jgi:DNA-binding transcriptional MerR regulator
MNELLLKPGEFAYLCATTKETLRHYRDVGLLCPAHTADNGYQYYSVVQILDFLLISALRSAGCSLKEIQSYLTMPSTEELREVLVGMREALGREKHEIERKERLLKNTIARLDLLKDAPEQGAYRFEECPAEYYIETPMGSDAPLDSKAEDNVKEALRGHLEYCREYSFGEELQFTYRIGHEAFLDGEYLRDIFLCSRVSSQTRSKRLHVKPKGRYLKLLRKLTIPDEPGTMGLELANAWFDDFSRFRAYAIDNGYRIVGDVYETELSLYTGNAQDSFNVEISALVEKNSEASNTGALPQM